MNNAEELREIEKKKWAEERMKFNLKYPSEEVIRFLKNKCKNTSDLTVLDFGCGSGRNTLAMCEMMFKKVIAMDYNQECLDLTKQKTACFQNIDYVKNERLSIPLPDHSVDVIVAWGSMFYFDERERTTFLKEILRVVKKDGIIAADFRGIEDGLFGMGARVGDNLFLLDERAGALQNIIYWFCNEQTLRDLFENNGFDILNFEHSVQQNNNLKDVVEHWRVWASPK